ncbi:MAG: hypothetical protein LBD44_02405 [Spirochaetaceae bacterium]|nr:hypothetical protein [Spirochaetaceae bacterium]
MSDAFEKIEGYEEVNLELIVEFRNINKGHNEELVKKCKLLDGYVKFVGIVKDRNWIMSLFGQVESMDELRHIIETTPIPTGNSGIDN